MEGLLNRIHAAGWLVWTKFIQFLNRIALGVGALALTVNTMYPTAVSEALGAVPKPIKFGGLIIWAGIIEYATRRAKKSADIK